MNKKNIPFSVFLIVGILFPLSAFPVSENVNEHIEMTNSPVLSTESAGQDLEGYTEFFISNNGQIGNDDISFYTTDGPVKTGFRENGITIAVETEEKGFSYEVEFMDGGSSGPSGMEELDHHTNYFIGSDPDGWHTDIVNFESIIYHDVWDRIDIVYRIVQGRLKYDILVHPGGDVGDVMFRFVDIHPELIDGELLVPTPVGDVLDDAPFTYQSVNEIPSEWHQISDSIFGFNVDQYDPDMELVIDPGLSFSSFAGGSSLDKGRGIVVDSSGYSYVTGYTASSTFPTTTGAYDTVYGGGNNGDVFAMKVNVSGDRLIYSTYLGGGGNDYGMSIDLDSSGNAYIGGQTYSNNFPTMNAYDGSYFRNGDAFVTKLSPAGNSLVYSTYIGGWTSDAINGIKVNSGGNAFVTGTTGYVGWSQYRYPTTSGAYDRGHNGNDDVFVTKLSTNGRSLDYSTFIGGGNDDVGYGIELDSNGNAYIVGRTVSSDFPTTSGAYDQTYGGSGDGFMVKLDSSGGSLSYSTFIGGGGSDAGLGIVLDSSDRAYITGYTGSNNFPTTSGAYDTTYNGNTDSFITMLSSDGSTLMNSTYVGGSGYDSGKAIALGADGMVHITGYTTSSNYPTTSDAFSTSRTWGNEVFVSKMDIGGAVMKYSTYIGGSNNEEASGIQVDSDGFIYITGETDSRDFPTSFSGFDISYNSNDDVFITKFYPADFSPSTLTSESGYFFVNLSWQGSAQEFFDDFGIIGYRIYRRSGSSALVPIAEVGNVTEYQDIIDIFISSEYHYRVTALFNTIGESKFSNMVSETPDVTPRPFDPVADAGDMFVNLTWQTIPSQYFSMFDITYSIFRGLDPNYLLRIADVGPVDWYNDTDIAGEPRTYYYGVTYVIRGIGESNMTNLVQAKPNTPPSAPSNVSTTAGDLQTEIRWNAPDDNGGYPLDSYLVYRGISPGTMDPFMTIPSTNTNLIDNGVEAGITYHYQITAMNDIGHSFRSRTASMNGQTVPSEPQDLTLIEGDGKVDIRWNEPADMWSIPIMGYSLKIDPGTGSRAEEISLGPEIHSYTHDVPNGEVFFYSVSASNVHGEGDDSGPLEGRGRGVPGEPIDPSISIGDRNVILDWDGFTSDGGEPLTYVKVYRGNDIQNRQHIASLPPNTTSFTLSGLTNGETYYFWISGVNPIGEGIASLPLPATPGRAPGMITGLTLLPGLGNVVVEWSPPADTGGRDLLEYVVYRGSSIWTLKEVFRNLSSGTSFIDGDRIQGQNYVYAISAINNFGEGPRSEPQEAIPYGRPSAPRMISHSVGSTSVELEWTVPDHDGGSEITGYLVEYRSELDTEWDTMEFAGTSGIVTDLRKGDEYTFRVKARNFIADGLPSDDLVTHVGLIPEPPTSVSLTSGVGQIRVEWSHRPPGSLPIIGYRLFIAVNGGQWNYVDEVGKDRDTYVFENLVTDSTYTVSISSINEIGEGERSANRTLTLKGIPSPPEIIWIEDQGPEGVILRWLPPVDQGGDEVIEYRIFRGASMASLTVLKTVTSPALDDTNLGIGKSYFYSIASINEQGSSAQSRIIEASTRSVPSPPNDLRAEATSDEVLLKWDAPSSDGGFELTGYLVYRSLDGGVPELISELGSDSRGFKDRSVSSGSYTYDIVPVNSLGKGESSSIDADVPGRTLWSIMSLGISLLLPLLIFLAIAFLPGYLKKRKERKEKEEEMRRVKEAEIREQQMLELDARRRSTLPPGRGHVPGLAPAHGGVAHGLNQLPPVSSRVDETKTGEGYIRPADMKKKKTDRMKVLRADGKSVEQREAEKHLSEIKSNGNATNDKYHKERHEALKKEAASTFTGQQTVGPEPQKAEEGSMEGFMAAPTSATPVEPINEGHVENEEGPDRIKGTEPPEEDIPNWAGDEIPIQEPPTEEVEEMEEIEELDELEG